MAIAEELQILVDAKVSQAVRELGKVDKAIGKTSKTTDKLNEIFKKLAGPLSVGAVIYGLTKLGKELIKVASDAEETEDKFGVVFSTVADEAQAAADRVKKEFRLSDETVEKFLSGIGDITTGLGATGTEALSAAEQITKLGLDISSLSNIDAEQSVRALTGLFTGEREAAKALGIVINDTNLKQYAEDMGKVFKELTPLEKGFLSLELATKQSGLAIGNAALTAGSYANTAKASAEATKDFKAALGESLLPAATESLKIFTSLTTKLTEYVKEHNDLRELLNKFKDDKDTAQDRVDLTEREIAATQKLYDENLKILTLKQGTAQNQLDQNAIDLLFDKASLLNTELRAQQALLATLKEEAAAEKAVSDAIANKAAETQKLAALQLELSSTLETRRREALTDDEIAIDNLQKQIDYWAEFREVVGVQQLLTDLVRERDDLIAGQTEDVALLADAFVNLTFQANAYKNALMDAEFAHREFTDGTIEGNAAAAKSWEYYAEIGLGAVTNGFVDIGKALVGGKLGIEDFGKLFLSAASQILSALGAELAALATVQLLLGNFAGAAAGYLQSGAAFLASGVVQGLAGSFEDGGIIPGTPSRTDNKLAMVASGEEVLTMDDPRHRNNGGGQTRVIVNIGKRAIIDAIGQASRDGTLIIDSRSVK